MAIHWRFIPTLNPDGMFAKPARRVNAHGVDLNRNFPTPNWARESRLYWRCARAGTRVAGRAASPCRNPNRAFSCSRWTISSPTSFERARPFGVLDFDGPSEPPKKLGRLFLDQVGIYPGSLGNYGGIHKGVPVVTVELPQAARTPQDAEMRQMWLDLLRWTSGKLGPGQVVARRHRTAGVTQVTESGPPGATRMSRPAGAARAWCICPVYHQGIACASPFQVWPKRLPHAITLPATSLWDNLKPAPGATPTSRTGVFGSVLTYAQLLQKTERLAQYLRG